MNLTTVTSLSVSIGQPVDGPHNGPAPGPWDIQAQPAQKFRDATTSVEVPHTASVKVSIISLEQGDDNLLQPGADIGFLKEWAHLLYTV